MTPIEWFVQTALVTYALTALGTSIGGAIFERVERRRFARDPMPRARTVRR